MCTVDDAASPSVECQGYLSERAPAAVSQPGDGDAVSRPEPDRYELRRDDGGQSGWTDLAPVLGDGPPCLPTALHRRRVPDTAFGLYPHGHPETAVNTMAAVVNHWPTWRSITTRLTSVRLPR